MLSSYEKNKINKELKEIIGEFNSTFDIIRQRSEDKYKTTLKAGETFRPQNGFYFDEDRQAFAIECEKYRTKAHDLVDNAINEVRELNTKAPSTEAVNTVMLLNTRNDVSAEEIDQLMTKYGLECPMVYKSLYEKAQSLGYRDFKQHPIVEEAENMEALSNVIDRTFNADRAENSNKVAITAGFCVTTDNAFPVSE